MNRVLRLAFIGCGRATAELHLPALRAAGDVEVVALVDPEPARLRTVGDRFGIADRWPVPEPVWEDPRVDVVAVCTPPRFHVPLALAALAADKHVFVEKPLALDPADSARLVAAAARSPKQATVGFNLRHHRLVRGARALLDRGALGPVEFVHSVASSSRCLGSFPEWHRLRSEGGGVLGEQAVHHYDLWRFLLGAELREIAAIGRSDGDPGQTLAVNARLSSGAVATGAFSQHAAEDNRLEIFGRKGRLSVSFYRFDGLEYIAAATYPGDWQNRGRALGRSLRQLPRAVAAAPGGGEYHRSYVRQWRDFLTGIRQNRPAACTLADGHRAQQAVAASVEASRTGGRVPVDQG